MSRIERTGIQARRCVRFVCPGSVASRQAAHFGIGAYMPEHSCAQRPRFFARARPPSARMPSGTLVRIQADTGVHRPR